MAPRFKQMASTVDERGLSEASSSPVYLGLLRYSTLSCSVYQPTGTEQRVAGCTSDPTSAKNGEIAVGSRLLRCGTTWRAQIQRRVP